MCYYLGWLHRQEGFSQAEFPKYIWEMDYSCLKAHHPFLESSSAQLALPGFSGALFLLLSTTPLLRKSRDNISHRI